MAVGTGASAAGRGAQAVAQRPSIRTSLMTTRTDHDDDCANHSHGETAKEGRGKADGE
jgi:hypothetical protein